MFMFKISLKYFFVIILVYILPLNGKIYQNRPKIKTSDGDLILEPALDKNIYLRPNGPKSSVFIGNIDVLKTNTARDAVQLPLPTKSDDYVNERIELLSQKLLIMEIKLQSQIALVNISLWNKVNSLNRKVINLQNIVGSRPKNKCNSSPCQNGGTCLNLVDGYHCLCPSNWEGSDCDVDVNECRNFAGTDLGCQNGATCVNKPGTYECLCKSDWYGTHCTRKVNDCSGGDFEMCGHGTCVAAASGEGIKCICHQGWTSNTTSITCLTDINECNIYPGSRCSVNPSVECINLPGSYQCGQCPSGYEGDGHICNDIDECIITPNGGCSPMVMCYNIIGSRICGSCPTGYQGDGVTCTYKGSCSINHGGCHSSARCLEELSPTGFTVQCICPEGMDGDGLGFVGCYVSTGNYTSACENSPCGDHGQCHSLRTGYTCICNEGFGGAHCALLSGCATNPCQNGGLCKQDVNAGFRCECTALYSGSLCQVRLTSCGGKLSAEEGTIAFPLSNISETYNHNAQCEWVIQTNPNKILNITFTKFNIDLTPECAGDYLQIHDGRQSSSQLIGRFCGDTLPKGGTIVSSHNNIYLWFHSDSTEAKTGFVLHWTSVKPVCGGEIDATIHGHISSPGSPGPYPPNRDCFWHFTTTPGKRISLHFFALDIGIYGNCSSDYLAIYDGSQTTDPLVSKYCSSTQPPSRQSASFNLLVHFHSSSHGSGKGFHIAYESVEGIPGCGGYFTTDKGEIASPTYDGRYLDNMFCEYKIKTGLETKIQIEFKLFRLQNTYGYTCTDDYLKIYDGPSSDSLLVGAFCGTKHPGTYISSSNTLYLIFRSNLFIAADGFRITYETVCENSFYGDSGIIKSPLYPLYFLSSKICTYMIRTDPGKAIKLTFQDIQIKTNSFGSCRFNNIEVRDGPDINSTLLDTYCSNPKRMPPFQISTLNYIYIKLETDLFGSGMKLYANYSTINTECGGIYRKTSDTINYSSDNVKVYNNNQTCIWLIVAPEGEHIKVTWNRFDIKNISDCSYYLELIEIDRSDENDILGTYCGLHTPPVFTTVTNQLKLQLVSGLNIHNSSFSLSYTFINDTTECGGIYIKSHGTLYSPGWPKSYERNTDCTWVIKVPTGQQISLHIVYFELPELVRNQCQHEDYLEIKNGASQTSPLIGQFCGKLQSKHISSLTNALYLYFHSNARSTAKGFEIEWDSTITGCGGTLTSATGSILSPNYPNNYNENAECFYKIITSAGSRIGISFTELDLERTNNCNKDYIEIFDGRDSNAPSLGKHCLISPKLLNITTTTNFAFVKFRSDAYISAKGFMLNYYTICNNTLTGRYGVIESPNYPNDYPLNMLCNWKIQVDKGNKIKVIFTHFDISIYAWDLGWEYNPNTNKCAYDNLQISELSSSLKFCGSDLPNAISSKSNIIEIQLTSVGEIAYSGFRLEWSSYGCGGHIRKQRGTVSLDKNLNTEETMECEWLIETMPGKSINITFTKIYMLSSENCTLDAIEIYNGQSNKAPLISKICHESHASINSDSNFVVIRLIKLSTLKYVHFIAHFNSLESRCGGSIYSMSGYIYSKNYPRNYDNNQDCIWYVSVPVNHRIQINFIDLDLYSMQDGDTENNDLCGDSILIYDNINFTQSSNYTYIICNNLNNTQLLTKHNNIVVQFKTDSHGTAKGFKAYFNMACGSIISASQDGIITNNKYITYSNKNCVWTIVAPTPNQKISVTITHMALSKDTDVMTNRSCPSTFLRILDGNDNNAPLIDEFCGRRVPPMIVSQGSAITIVFGSYIDKISGNFSVHYSSITSACGGELTAEEGSIASPSFPKHYPINVDCEWVLSTSPGNAVYVTFERIDLEYSERCNEDYLELRENDGTGKLLGVYCGSDIPTNHTSAENIYIKFHSNSRMGGQGFLLHFAYSHENYIYEKNGEITSPLYPTYYEGAGEYSWHILTSDEDKIALKIYQMEIPSHGALSYNKLSIFDGYDSTAPILEQLYGIIDDVKYIEASSSTVYIMLTLDESNIGSMFRLSWTQASKIGNFYEIKCGFNSTEYILPGQITTLIPPYYTEEYRNSVNCEWIYKTQMGRHLGIAFSKFGLVKSIDCFTGSISIYSADTFGNWKPIKKTICQSKEVGEEINASTFMKIEYKTVAFTSKRDNFQAVIKSKCGGLVTDLSGEIGPIWLDINETLDRLKCDWTIKVRPGRTIKFKFANFNISSENNQCQTFVVLRNGDSVESPLLASGKYCGNEHEIKVDMITSGNALFVSYTSKIIEIPFVFQSFKIYYEEKNDECGSTSKLTSVHKWEIINSPSYPSVPIPYSECVWIFSSAPDVLLRIDFIDRFDIDDDANDCGTEVVEIRDGSTNLSPVIGRYCGKKPPTIKSTSNSIFIKYATKLLEPRNGFKANISIDVCGGTITSEFGELKSPGYPHLLVLPPGTVCEWHIIGSSEHTYFIKILDINIPISQSQCTTKIEIAENNPLNNKLTLLKTICNNDFTPIETSSNHFIIRFTVSNLPQSLAISDYRGFQISFNSSQKVCGGRITTTEGYITTPNYPEETTVRECGWIIELPNKARRVRLEIIDSNQEKHKFKIFNDLFVNEIKRISSMDSTSINKIYESVANNMGIHIILNPLARSHRFKAKFTSDEQALCGGDLSSINQEIVSPNIERSYSCKWHYNNLVPINENDLKYNSILIILNLNSSISRNECRFDPLISIKSPVTNNRQQFSRKICGNAEVSYRIPSSILDLTATKGENDSLNFSLAIKSQPCGGIVHVSENSINIIVVPESYNDTLDCAWLLVIPSESRIEIEMLGSFSLECEDEYVKIIPNINDDISLGNYCKGNVIESPLITHYAQMYIQYHSKVKNNTNIKLMVKSTSNQCGGLITSYQNIFTSPNFPKPYTANEECAWEIQADLGFRVSLQFIERFVVEDSPNCTKDVVIIYDWKNEAYEEIARLCGRNLPPLYKSTHTRLKVVLRTDAETNLDGFKAQWILICGGSYIATEKEQILYSPGYPVSYKPNMDCSYSIITPKSEKIFVQFLEFELEGFSPECLSDNLTIDATKYFNKLHDIFCGNKIPKTIQNYDVINLNFKSDDSVQYKGFKIAYYIYHCGGRINDPTVLTPTFHGDGYGLNCTWIIEAPPTKVVIFKILYINLPSNSQCTGHHIALYNSRHINMDKRLALLCGYINSTTTLKSIGTSMVFQYVVWHGANKENPFKAVIYFSSSEALGCGGPIHLTDSSLHVLRSPIIANNAYENYLDCDWSITSPPGTVIKITFNKFHIAPCQYINKTAIENNRCDCDLVEINDGLPPNNLDIGTYCGDTLPPQLMTSGNIMNVRLATDGEVVSSGFEATLTVQQTLCGESVIPVRFTPQRLKSPNFDTGSVPRGLQCIYRLDNHDEPLQVIRITVINLQLRSSGTVGVNRCIKDRFVISSTPYPLNSTIGKDFIVNHNFDDYFTSVFSFDTRVRLAKRFELCGHKADVHFYVSGSTSITLTTSPDTDDQIYKGVEVEIALIGHCGRNYTEPQGRIIKVKHSYFHVYNSDCYTLITAPENYTISLYFLIATSHWSETKVLKIYDGNNTSTQQLAAFNYLNDDSSPIFSTGRYMLLHRPKNIFGAFSYDVNYVTTNKGVGCGGKLYNQVGAVTSPSFPKTYRHNNVCEWVLETPEGTRLMIRFKVFDLGVVVDQNYLQLVDRNGVVVRTFASEPPADYTSFDNYIKLVFHTTMNNSGKGWSAVFAAIQD